MKSTIVIIGIGELAGVFARGFLRCGHPVYPITRDMNMASLCLEIPTPEIVLITVQENELHPVLEQIPDVWRDKIALVQNELLPRDWQTHQIDKPTVTVVWFEKKKNLELTHILYSPSYGPNSELMSNALQAMGIAAPILNSHEELLYELTRKALYILTVNIAGLLNNCTVEELWLQHQDLATEIAEEIITILEFLAEKQLPQEKLINGMVEGINDCPGRYCKGRRALGRLERALNHAQKGSLNTPKLQQIYTQVNSKG